MATTPVDSSGQPDTVQASATARRKAAFISHSSEDAEFAARLCALLEAKNLTCWIAPRDLVEGQPWPPQLMAGIAVSESFILLASESALGSVDVLNEVHQAHKLAKPLYTVLIPPAKVRGEMDYYLSRWHWLSGGGKTPEEIASKLVRVLGRQLDWRDTANLPPSLRRTMLYRPVAFAKQVAAAALALILVFGAGVLALRHFLASQPMQIGYLAMGTSADSGPPIQIHPRVWITAKGVAFQDARLLAVTDAGDRSETLSTQWPMPEQVGSTEQVVLALKVNSRRLTTCLILPNPALGSPWRVTQQFTLHRGDGEVRIAEIAEPRATREDGSPCGANP